ncbi:MAG: hypothetical protein EOP53_13060, partial [Sphingobacteriales bacterium]
MKQLFNILTLLLLAQYSFAGVDLRHGLFYISYSDMEFPGAKAEIGRSYNSSNTRTGFFGYGWSSFIETKLSALPDGTLSLNWWGNGLGDYYEPAVVNRKGLYEMLNAIIKDLVKNKKLDNEPGAIAEKKSWLLNNPRQRAEKYIELQKKNIAALYFPDAGSSQKWILDANQVIEWTGKTFMVKSWDDRYEFNSKGQLVLVNDKAYKMQLFYSNNRIEHITVDDSSTCNIDFDDKGRIVQLKMKLSNMEKIAVFKYDSSDNLIYSKDAGNNEYRFSYDLYHNLVRINYVDSTSLEMVYDAANNRIIKLKDTKGGYTTYQYPYFYTTEGKINYDHYATKLQQYDKKGRLLFSQYKEFENRSKDDGTTYLHRMLEQTDTSYHEVLYAPEVGNARYRKKNNKEAWAVYDAKGRTSYLHINDSIYKTFYNSNNLPESFIAIDSIKQDSVIYNYQYNE